MIVSSRLVTSRHVTSCHVMSRHVRENEIFINAVNLDCKLRSIFCALALFSSNKVSRRRSCCSRTTSRRTQNQMESKKFSSSRNVNVILNILENCLLLKLYRKTQKNVSEPQKGITGIHRGLLSAIWVLVAQWLERLTGDQKVAGSIPVCGSETFFWVLR